MLYSRYPALANSLPRFPLLSGPTPVRPMYQLMDRLGHPSLFVKTDSLCSPVWGGNKVRKLEFLLGDALARDCREVITFGFAGSNHCTATAVCASAAGLGCTSFLSEQENAQYVRKNLLTGFHAGAKLVHTSLETMQQDSERYVADQLRRTDSSPYVVPAGGSSPIGVCAFVAAAFELAGQIAAGELHEPDYLFVPMGTAGTAAGLVVGLRAAGLATRVVAVSVVDPDYMNGEKLCQIANSTAELLRTLDPTFPNFRVSAGDFMEETGFFGGGYAHITEEAAEAIQLGMEDESLPLEGTYTGKAFAAMISYAREGHLHDRLGLYWHTLNAVAHPAEAQNADFRNLPDPFHRYFTEPAQDE